nr:ephrin-B2-like isoform X1 [Pocillopora verrucosa]
MPLARMESCGHRVTIMCFSFCFLLSAITGSVAEILPSILWNSENPFFNNLHERTRNVMEFDQLSIICPTLVDYPIKRTTTYLKDLLYENVYMVDKKGFDKCNATGGLSVLSCNDPVGHIYYRVVFQPHTVNPNDPKFEKGKEYYFISTASGSQSSLTNTQGGHCNSGMKMKIYVCESSSDPKCPNGNSVVNGGWSDWSECSNGLQRRKCNKPAPASGGLPCVGDEQRACSTEAAQVLCKGHSCTNPTVEGQTSTTPGLPSRENRTGDNSGDKLELNRGLFVGICLSIFIFGIFIGGIIAILVCRVSRRKSKTNAHITRVPSKLTGFSRPTSLVSTLSTVSESAQMVKT